MKTSFLLMAWFLLIAGLALRGMFDLPTQPAPFGLILALTVPLILYLLDRWWLRRGLFGSFHTLDARTSVAIQAYRLVPGFFFLAEAARGAISGGFAIQAGVGDAAVGILAPWVASLLEKENPYARRIAFAWNVVGILDLVTAIVLGVLYSASPLGVLAGGLTSQELVQYPLCLIPAWVVPISFILHFRSLQTLAGRRLIDHRLDQKGRGQ